MPCVDTARRVRMVSRGYVMNCSLHKYRDAETLPLPAFHTDTPARSVRTLSKRSTITCS